MISATPAMYSKASVATSKEIMTRPKIRTSIKQKQMKSPNVVPAAATVIYRQKIRKPRKPKADDFGSRVLVCGMTPFERAQPKVTANQKWANMKNASPPNRFPFIQSKTAAQN
ncbi:hypothetical protein BLNAU_21784 [Blattamonas nauphoetae]|uniref:Uncharacterized protein n=1 Tax=Blattamonas nauphoetae TaxID=2049346 RepID=A0ABQ9WUY1_9EUKA|nr:hypothetical protein BLNAU_21784 [Blattamonas nauphoetae]